MSEEEELIWEELELLEEEVSSFCGFFDCLDVDAVAALANSYRFFARSFLRATLTAAAAIRSFIFLS